MITFEYPGYNPTESITLGAPEKGDNKSLTSELFIHQTESGQFKSNVSISCISEFERIVSFTGLCKEQIEEFKTFVQNSIGHYIKYTDYNGEVWMTQITDEVISISEDPSGYSIDLNLLVWEV